MACKHRTFYWINRKHWNWRCTDQCGYQFFGMTVTQVRRRDRIAEGAQKDAKAHARRVGKGGG